MISVFLSFPFPNFFNKYSKYRIEYLVIYLMSFLISSISFSIPNNFSFCLRESYFVILLILISVNDEISSSETSSFKSCLKGSILEDITLIIESQVSQSSISLYILFSMNIFSSVSLCHCLSSVNKLYSKSFFRFFRSRILSPERL